MSKNNFFHIGWGCSRDHLGPHKTQKWPEKRAENRPKTARDRPRSAAPRPEAYFNKERKHDPMVVPHLATPKHKCAGHPWWLHVV